MPDVMEEVSIVGVFDLTSVQETFNFMKVPTHPGRQDSMELS
jgi:hypothetical protein